MKKVAWIIFAITFSIFAYTIFTVDETQFEGIPLSETPLWVWIDFGLMMLSILYIAVVNKIDDI